MDGQTQPAAVRARGIVKSFGTGGTQVTVLRGIDLDITSRICGICATGHATTSLRASEKALGIQPSEQTVLLRKLSFHGEILDSPVLHVYMLIAPDFLGVGSVIPLAKSHPEVVLRALRMKKLAGDICAAVTGRHTHPIAMTVGGFTHFPKAKELEDLRKRLVASREDVDATVG